MIEYEYVFVYGTLKRNGDCNEVLSMSSGRYVCDAIVTGLDLFLLPAGFPAAVVSSPANSDNEVKGEIWEVKTLVLLDQLEGNGHHYNRVKLTCQTSDGIVTGMSILDAWVYLYMPHNRLDYAMPLVSGSYPGLETACDLLCEWAAYHSWKTPFGYDGFEVYEKDDPQCYMDCEGCPYQHNCQYSVI